MITLNLIIDVHSSFISLVVAILNDTRHIRTIGKEYIHYNCMTSPYKIITRLNNLAKHDMKAFSF